MSHSRQVLISRVWILFLPVVLISGGPVGLARQEHPEELLNRIERFREQYIAEAESKGGEVNYAELAERTRAMARQAVSGVDPSDVDAGDGLAWIRLFEQAGQLDGVEMLCRRFLETDPPGESAFLAQIKLMRAYGEMGNVVGALKLIESLQAGNPGDAINIMLQGGSAIRDLARTARDLKPLLEAADVLYALVPTALKGDQPVLAAYYGARTRVIQAELLDQQGQTGAALELLDGTLKSASLPDTVRRYVSGQRVLLQLVGKPAPSFRPVRTLGGFNSLESFKGKVVVLDFFAHWCGPCIAAFPELRALRKDLGSEGLEVLGLTTFYGYFGTQEDLGREREFELV